MNPDNQTVLNQALERATKEEQAQKKSMAEAVARLSPERRKELTNMLNESQSTADKLYGGPNVKAPSARYSDTSYVAKHAKTGMPVQHKGQDIHWPSERENALTGVYFKDLARRKGELVNFTEHETELLKEVHAGDWVGCLPGSEEVKTFNGSQVKAVLSDSTSGGLEANPIFFDSRLVTFPLLYGELMPFVDLVDVPRSNRVEGASIGNPTVSYGVESGTEMPVFDSTSLIAAIDTNLYSVVCAIEIGRDFLSDSPADIGRIITENIGQSMANSLDTCIAEGNGTDRPQGIKVASITDIGNPASGANGVAALEDYLELYFTVPKAYRQAGWRPRFLMNDTTYSRARGIKVGASDQRLVLGLDVSSYNLFGVPVSICNDLANTECLFGCFAKYRLYRRAGASVEWTNEGKELRTKNLALLTVRGRYGGKLMDNTAFCWSDSWTT